MTTLTYQKPTDIDSRRIKVSLIDVPETYEPEDSLVEDDTLRRSIENSGVQQSIHVIPAARGRFTLVDGARRVLISRLLELDTIPAIVHETDAPGKLRFILNQLRQDLLPSQRAGLIVQLQKSFQMTQKAVAAYLGVNEGTISNWVSVLEYVPEIQRAIDVGEIKPFHARAFDGMTAEGQRAVWESVREALPKMSGKIAHKEIREAFSPKEFPKLYVSAIKTIEKLGRKRQKRAAKKRPVLSFDEKKKLSHDLGLREVELKDGREELKQLKREIALATPIIRAIYRNKDLALMIPPEMKDELDRFKEVYV